MNNYEFYDLLFENINLYFLLTFFVFLTYFFIFKRVVTTIIDPLLLPLIYSAIGTTTVLLLFLNNTITNICFTSYCFTQLAFFAGFFTLSRKTVQPEYTVSDISPSFVRQIKLAFVYFSIILILTQLFVYAQRGIPLFQFSRLDTFVGGSGFGVYSRFIDISNIAIIYLYFVLFFYKKSLYFTWFYHLVLLLVLLFLFLSGSKTALLVIPYVLFTFLRLHKNNQLIMQNSFVLNLRKRMIYILSFATVLVLIVIKVQSDITDSLANPFIGLLLRLVHSGDTFWYAYPWNMYAKIDGSHPFLALFNDTMGFFRIYNWSDLPESLGFVLIKLQHTLDGNYGPNARQNVFGLVYFKFYGSIIFSFLLGLGLSFIRNVLPRFCNKNFIVGIFFTILFINAPSLEVDPVLALAYFNNAFLIYPLLILVFLVIYSMLEWVKPSKHSSLKLTES